ncbi:MAG: hypothetical protein II747_06805, partial [Clostridia bacterium]|nr:hypothetical protein [Clostridia bacterium]
KIVNVVESDSRPDRRTVALFAFGRILSGNEHFVQRSACFSDGAIGLAERNEEIILPDSEESVILPRSSSTLHLLQRIRDEAHRFAITYHRSMRSKTALFSVLQQIDGVGEKRRRALFDIFLTLDAIKAASVEELASAEGMNRAVAQKVHDYFNGEETKQ